MVNKVYKCCEESGADNLRSHHKGSAHLGRAAKAASVRAFHGMAHYIKDQQLLVETIVVPLFPCIAWNTLLNSLVPRPHGAFGSGSNGWSESMRGLASFRQLIELQKAKTHNTCDTQQILFWYFLYLYDGIAFRDNDHPFLHVFFIQWNRNSF